MNLQVGGDREREKGEKSWLVSRTVCGWASGPVGLVNQRLDYSAAGINKPTKCFKRQKMMKFLAGKTGWLENVALHTLFNIISRGPFGSPSSTTHNIPLFCFIFPNPRMIPNETGVYTFSSSPKAGSWNFFSSRIQKQNPPCTCLTHAILAVHSSSRRCKT